jgi:cytochrome oxidase Cu insertion factor (SCO1/SenC/PrrC family)
VRNVRSTARPARLGEVLIPAGTCSPRPVPADLSPARPFRRSRAALLAGGIAGALALAACGGTSTSAPGAAGAQQQGAAAANPNLDPGTSLGGMPAPGFRLVNQFGQAMSLSQFRGKVVILAFVDSRCTNVCPLTTVSMVEARQLLGAAADRVQLLGIDANPAATSQADMLAYSRVHGMVNQWDFLTGSRSQLQAVWKSFHIYAKLIKGQVDHTPALYVIDTRGREQKIYLTSMAYASVGQEAQVLAQEAASLLPGHPRLAAQSSLGAIGGLGPASQVTLPTAGSGSVILGPGHSHLVVFFASWLSETSDLRAQLLALNGYARAARGGALPALTGVDETVTEPSAAAVRDYLDGLSYPVALDKTGRLADGYGVQDQPWFVLTSASGKIIWKHDGWLPLTALETAVRHAVG